MPFLDNLEYLNLNSLRSYPIRETCTRKSSDNFIIIPDDFIVEVSLAVSSDPTARVYISSISNQVNTINVEISDQSDVVIGNFIIDTTTHTTYKDYYLTVASGYTGANGRLTVNTTDTLNKLGRGKFLFSLAAAEFETKTIVPSMVAVDRITFSNFDGGSHTVTGNVVVEARTNTRFKYLSSVIYLDAGENLGLNQACSELGSAIRTINGIPGDSSHNFTIDFSDCITVTPLPSNTGIILDDICCKPCAGCDEIETLTNRLTALESELIALRNYYTNLLATFDNFQISIHTTCAC